MSDRGRQQTSLQKPQIQLDIDVILGSVAAGSQSMLPGTGLLQHCPPAGRVSTEAVVSRVFVRQAAGPRATWRLQMSRCSTTLPADLGQLSKRDGVPEAWGRHMLSRETLQHFRLAASVGV